MNKGSLLFSQLKIIEKKLTDNIKNNKEDLQEYYKLKGEYYKQVIDLNKEDKNISFIIDNLDHYILSTQSLSNNKSLDRLTYINFVVLPLGLITGYFGMNFYHMGNPRGSKGILLSKHYNIYIFTTLVITCISGYYIVFNTD